jgi:hypothetical protein
MDVKNAYYERSVWHVNNTWAFDGQRPSKKYVKFLVVPKKSYFLHKINVCYDAEEKVLFDIYF